MSRTQPGQPVVIGNLVIEPVERTFIDVRRIGDSIVGVAQKAPVAVVIRTPSGTWTVDLEGLAPAIGP